MNSIVEDDRERSDPSEVNFGNLGSFKSRVKPIPMSGIRVQSVALLSEFKPGPLALPDVDKKSISSKLNSPAKSMKLVVPGKPQKDKTPRSFSNLDPAELKSKEKDKTPRSFSNLDPAMLKSKKKDKNPKSFSNLDPAKLSPRPKQSDRIIRSSSILKPERKSPRPKYNDRAKRSISIKSLGGLSPSRSHQEIRKISPSKFRMNEIQVPETKEIPNIKKRNFLNESKI